MKKRVYRLPLHLFGRSAQIRGYIFVYFLFPLTAPFGVDQCGSSTNRDPFASLATILIKDVYVCFFTMLHNAYQIGSCKGINQSNTRQLSQEVDRNFSSSQNYKDIQEDYDNIIKISAVTHGTMQSTSIFLIYG